MFEIIKSKIKNFKEYFTAEYASFRKNRKEYLKQILISAAKAAKATAIFALKAALKTAAFLLATIFFIEALQFILAGQLAMASLFLVPAIAAFVYSRVPDKIVTFEIKGKKVVSTIAASVIWVAKKIFLGIVDHLIEEFGIAQYMKEHDRPVKQFFELDKDLVETEEPSPSITFNSYVESPQYTFGILNFTPLSAVLRYAFPHEITYKSLKNWGKKIVNYFMYASGLSDRAKNIANHDKIEAKNKKILESSEQANAQLLKIINETKIANPINHLHEALLHIISTPDLRLLRTPDGKNLLHYLQKLIINEDTKEPYTVALQAIVNSKVSPYARDDNGETAFGTFNSESENTDLLRTIVHGKYPKLIGLENQIKTLENFIANVKNDDPDTANLERRCLILDGPPGVGKTLAINEVMTKNGVVFLEYKPASGKDGVVGGQTTRILEFFEHAKSLDRPVCIFIDEMDSILHKDETSVNSQHDRLPINTFQTAITKLAGTKCFVIGATNYFMNIKAAIISRAGGSALHIQLPNVDAIEVILNELLKMYIIKDGAAVIRKLAENFSGMSPRDLTEYVAAVTSSESVVNTKIVSVEDLNNACQTRTAMSNDVAGLSVFFKDLVLPNPSEDLELISLEKGVLKELNLLKDFFAPGSYAAKIYVKKNVERVLFRGFSALKFINTIKNSSFGPTLYFDAANITDINTFLPKLLEKINRHEKVLLVIDNIDHLKKSDLDKISNPNGLLFVVAATENSSPKSECDWKQDDPMWKKNINVTPSIPGDEEELRSIIKAKLLHAKKHGVPMTKYLVDSAFKLAELYGKKTNKQQVINLIDESIGSINGTDKPMLTYSRMKETILKFNQRDSTVAHEDDRERRANESRKFLKKRYQ